MEGIREGRDMGNAVGDIGEIIPCEVLRDHELSDGRPKILGINNLGRGRNSISMESMVSTDSREDAGEAGAESKGFDSPLDGDMLPTCIRVEVFDLFRKLPEKVDRADDGEIADSGCSSRVNMPLGTFSRAWLKPSCTISPSLIT